ncbi:Acetoacetate decarboxylase (ADC) [compost metagenome]
MKMFPAPRTLQGKGYIMIYRFSPEFVKSKGRVPEFLQGKFAGGWGSVMLVDYASSNAGPYGELLFIPGKFHHKERKLNTISQIYVSSMESVVNGIHNWGIPKQLAHFNFEDLGGKRERVTVSVDGENVADLTLSAFGPSFPISTSLMPFPLVQLHSDQYYYTRFFGKGKGKLARVESIQVNGTLFPDISGVKPIAVIKVEPFKITFPVAEIEPVRLS